jgi:hypothetical protein
MEHLLYITEKKNNVWMMYVHAYDTEVVVNK